MRLTVSCVGESGVHEDVSRYATDEHNNLAVFGADGTLVALYATQEWKHVTIEEGS